MSVIIVSFNTRQTTLRCMEALCADLHASDAEIWLVDNGSSDGSADAVALRFPLVRIIRSDKNLGFAAANNLAIKESKGDRLLLLNSDAFLKPGAVSALGGYLDAHPEVAAVGPRLLNVDGSLQRSCFKFPGPLRSASDFLLLTAAVPNHPILGDYRAWPHDHDRIVDFVTGACMMIRRTALDETGLFDPSFFFYFEEVDWCMRASRGRWKIGFTPSAEVVHEGGGSGKAEADRVFNQFQDGHARFIRKHYGVAAAFFSRATLSAGALLRIAIFACRRLVNDGEVEVLRKWQRVLAWTLGLNRDSTR